jgi:hypothetical protein
MALSAPYPAQLEFQGDGHIARWRPLVQWLLAIPQLLIADVLSSLRNILTLISFFTVLFTKKIPRPLFDVIAMTYRYEWRTLSYVMFLHEDYPPFDFQPAATDDGVDVHSALTINYPEELSRWMPLVKWLLAIPHYVALFFLTIASMLAVVVGFFAVLVTGEYPQGIRDFVVGVYRWGLRVQAYIGLLTDQYPPFSLQPTS